MSKVYAAFLNCEAAIRRTIAKYCPQPADVDELTHETFLKCFAAERKADIREPERLLLFAAKNVALSEIKKKRNTTTDYIEDAPYSTDIVDRNQHDPEQHLNSRRKLAAFTMIIAQLSEDDRKILLMRKIDGMKYSQIATRMNISVSTVQKRLAASLTKCTQNMIATGYTPDEFGGKADSPKPDQAAAETSKTEWNADND